MISWRWRLALAAKGLLLLGLSLGFGLLAFFAVTLADKSIVVRLLTLLPCGFLSLFVGWAASLGLLDACVGRAVTESGAMVLKNRKQGYSLRLPSGRFVEFILWNPWAPLISTEHYTVTYGRFSGVIVANPASASR